MPAFLATSYSTMRGNMAISERRYKNSQNLVPSLLISEILSYLIRDSRGEGGLLYDAEFCCFTEHVRNILHIHLGIYALAVGVDCVDGEIDALRNF